MSRNGGRRAPSARIAVTTPGATREEIAAISAAIERFLEEAASAVPPAGPVQSAWLRAGLREGVGLAADRGRPRPWQ